MSDNSEDQKDLAFYTAILNAWISSSFENDKSILTLSMAGIGFLITLLTAFKVHSIFILLFYLFPIVLFLVCIFLILLIYYQNRNLLQKIIHLEENDEKTKNPKNKISVDKSESFLKSLDRAVFICFFLAILLSVVVGTLTGINEYKKQQQHLTEKSKNLKTLVLIKDQIKSLNKKIDAFSPICDDLKAIKGDISKMSFIIKKKTNIKTTLKKNKIKEKHDQKGQKRKKS